MLKKGQLVQSVQGRDKNKYFFIYEVLSNKFVNIVDGKLHLLQKPKTKNIKHLKNTNKDSDIFEYIDYTDIKSQNKKVYKTIENLIKSI